MRATRKPGAQRHKKRRAAGAAVHDVLSLVGGAGIGVAVVASVVAVSVEGAAVTAAGARPGPRDFLWRCAPGLRVARIASVPVYARQRLPRRPGLARTASGSTTERRPPGFATAPSRQYCMMPLRSTHRAITLVP